MKLEAKNELFSDFLTINSDQTLNAIILYFYQVKWLDYHNRQGKQISDKASLNLTLIKLKGTSLFAVYCNTEYNKYEVRDCEL